MCGCDYRAGTQVCDQMTTSLAFLSVCAKQEASVPLPSLANLHAVISVPAGQCGCAGGDHVVPAGGEHELCRALQQRPGPHHRILEADAGHVDLPGHLPRLPPPQIRRQVLLHVCHPTLQSLVSLTSIYTVSLAALKALWPHPNLTLQRRIDWQPPAFEVLHYRCNLLVTFLK